ncbi:MAG: DCC1-like thiol-disulfide oxidoreductase family protein [Bacteroidetes bacterium]|nr:DCC1-like thiol-disulfide oxidoreductase family protein [Bacteroidota bacterium]MDA0903712.1 DCC1-like thiol-disulfide oxidoreductase family protein [Bacteroidota bacterium]MDA1242468.1 DCC1-like thiol-disulfide oxidoreductase family protein [Bacteroidota bacterium]
MDAPQLFYDGPCRLCQRSVRWVHRRAPGVACIPLQSEEAQTKLPKVWTTPPLIGVVFVDAQGGIHVGHRALHALALHASAPWSLWLRLVPSWGYALVAQTRFLWGRNEGCRL